MAEAKPKTTVTMKMDASCPTHARTDVSVRDVEFVIDEPKDRGGTNLGPSPTETLIGALIGCTNVIGHRVGEANGVEFERMDVSAEAQFDRRGVTLADEVDVPFPEIVLTIEVTTDADDAALEKVKRDLGKYCPLAKVIRGSGTKLTENWVVKRS